MILARAGLERLGLAEVITWIVPTDIMIPAVGQGAIGIEMREGDTEVAAILASIEHPATRIAVDRERDFLRRLDGGCHSAIAAHATTTEDEAGSFTVRMATFVGEE